MADFSHVSPGTPKGKSPPSSASWVNAVSDATAHYQQRQAGGQSSGGKSELKRETAIVKVKNMVGTDIDLLRGHYVQLGTYLLDEVDQRKMWFEGLEYEAAKNGKIAILRAAIKADAIGEAQLLGVCTAVVNVSDIEHRFAEPVDTEHILASSSSGQIEILTPLTITGEQEVAVLLMGGAKPTVKLVVIVGSQGSAVWDSVDNILTPASVTVYPLDNDLTTSPSAFNESEYKIPFTTEIPVVASGEGVLAIAVDGWITAIDCKPILTPDLPLTRPPQ